MAVLALCAGPVSASVVITATEIGGNVVITSSGFYDVYNVVASPLNPFNLSIGMVPNSGILNFGTLPSDSFDVYTGMLQSPASFGTGGGVVPDSSTGDTFLLQPDSVGTPVGQRYPSANATMTFLNTNIAALGMTPGQYTWIWEVSPPEQPQTLGANPFSSNVVSPMVTFTIEESTAVPIPAALPLMLGGLGIIAAVGRRRRG